MPELNSQQNQDSKADQGASSLSQWMKSGWMKKQIERLLPGGDMNADRIWAICSRQINQTPELGYCTTPSVIGGVLESVTLGLMMGLNGECWLIPYLNSKKTGQKDSHGKPIFEKVWEAQLVIGYRGHLALAWRSEKIKSVSYDVVMAGDSFDYQKGSAQFLHHRPREDRNVGAAPDGMRFTWFQIETIWEGVIFDVYNKSDVERIRESAASKNSPAWRNWYRDMAIKTVANNVMKFAPQTAEISRAVSLGDSENAGIGQVFDVDLDFNDAPPALLEAERKRSPAQEMMDDMNDKKSDETQAGLEIKSPRTKQAVMNQAAQTTPAQAAAVEPSKGSDDELGY